VGVRVIAGELRGRRLVTAAGREVRPTADRVRETIFAILDARGAVHDRDVLDLCAGSGGMGIEALSRGAHGVVFVDTSPRARAALAENIAALRLADRARVVARDALAALAELHPERFGLVFADPPYATRLATRILDALGEGMILSAEGWCVLEHASDEVLPEDTGAIARVTQRRFGGTVVDVYSRSTAVHGAGTEGEST